jgi:hypothetical protein
MAILQSQPHPTFASTTASSIPFQRYSDSQINQRQAIEYPGISPPEMNNNTYLSSPIRTSINTNTNNLVTPYTTIHYSPTHDPLKLNSSFHFNESTTINDTQSNHFFTFEQQNVPPVEEVHKQNQR